MTRLLDVLGPIMIGPSSSHTAGAARLGYLARVLLGEPPVHVDVVLHGSFAATFRGHGTDLALVGGLLGFRPDDERIRDAMKHAADAGLSVDITQEDLGDVHPNTVRMTLRGATGKELTLMGSSVGGGKVEITELSGLPVSLSGERSALVAMYPDRPGVVASVTSILAKAEVNIATMRVARSGRGKTAVCIIEVDQDLPDDVVCAVTALPNMEKVIAVEGVR